MTLRLCLFVLFSTLLLTGPHAMAQDAGDGTLRVLRPIIRADQEKPELCLEFDHALGALKSQHLASSIHLTVDSRSMNVVPKIIDITGNQLCFTLPQHHAKYHLLLSDWHGQQDEKLVSPYSLPFTIPSRKPALTFVASGDEEGVLRGTDGVPVLRAVNVPDIKLELFHITDMAKLPAIWMQRRQAILAPSEMATTARAQGKVVWQGSMTIDAHDDELADRPVSLDDKVGALPNGFYLLVASAPELRAKETDLAPVAALWLMRSGMRQHIMSDPSHLYVLATMMDQSKIVNAHTAVLDQTGKIIASAQTNGEGQAVFAFDTLKRPDLSAVFTYTDGGDFDFTDLSHGTGADITLNGDVAEMTTDQAYYTPGERGNVTLNAHDIHNNARAIDDGSITLAPLQDSQATILTLPVEASKDGARSVPFVAPLAEGSWMMTWRQRDGNILGQVPLNVSANPYVPRLEIAANHNAVPVDGDLSFDVRSLAVDDHAYPYLAGHATLHWQKSNAVFPAWKAYHFGVQDNTLATDPSPVRFITDDKGLAHIRIKVSPPNDDGGTYQAQITLVSDKAVGAINPPQLVLPIKPPGRIIGIKPAVADGRFRENGFARFDILALDRDGKPERDDDLTYHVYEIGRSFDWFQQEGAWQYKPLQQQRLIATGAVSFVKDTTMIEWPAAAGSYRLEIVDAEDNMLAAYDFSSSAGGENTSEELTDELNIKVTPDPLVYGNEALIHFTLPEDADVISTIADDKVRALQHELRKKGDNGLAFTPTPDWGDRVLITLQARSGEHLFAGKKIVMRVNSGVKSMAETKKRPVSFSKTELVRDVSPEQKYQLKNATAANLAPQQVWTAPWDKMPAKKNQLDESLTFIAAASLKGLDVNLTAFADGLPFTTEELSLWLQASHRWGDVTVAAKFMTEAALQQRQHEFLMRIVSRQHADGSIGADPVATGTISSTAAAIIGLATMKQPDIKPVLDRAVDYLRRQLDNTWFDERERPARALASMALVKAGYLDTARLHYFADQSRDKKLPATAALNLALAFDAVHAHDETQQWLSAAAVNTRDDKLDEETLSQLSALSIVNPDDLQAALDAQAEVASRNPVALKDTLNHLNALEQLLARKEGWHITVNALEHSGNFVHVALSLPKSMLMSVHNLGAHAVSILSGRLANASKSGDLMRHVYRPDGVEMTGALQSGSTYVVVIEAKATAGLRDDVVIRDELDANLLRPTSCFLAGAADNPDLTWLAKLTLTTSCEVGTGAIMARAVAPADGESWRFAYLTRAENHGEFLAPSPVLQATHDDRAVISAAAAHFIVK